MNKIMAIFTLFFLASCKYQPMREVVSCDSGFTTGPQLFAYIDRGAVMWETADGHVFGRKMLPGEMCSERRVPKRNKN